METLLKITLLFFSLSFLSLPSNGQNEGLKTKTIERNIVKINNELYCSAFEVTNSQYSLFLEDLIENKNTTDIEKAQIDSLQWRNIHTYNEPFVTYYHRHPAYDQYPIVNISYEGASLYCQWLTEQYNSSKKRKFEQVLFRLPTEAEWIQAAKGGDPQAQYPWKGNELINAKGLLLCNFIRNSNDSMGVAGTLSDNADITAPVDSYWPNGYGIYNMSGNVAEMIAEKGKTMGGSWLDRAETMKIGSVGKFSHYETPLPTIGFRYVMEVMIK